MLGSGLGGMLGGGVAETEECGGSMCADLRQSEETVVERP